MQTFLANSIAYLDPAQLHALVHVSRDVRDAVRNYATRAANFAIDPVIQEVTNEKMYFVAITHRLNIETHIIYDHNVPRFTKLLIRALSRSSTTMFACDGVIGSARNSILCLDNTLADRKRIWIRRPAASLYVSELVARCACVRDDLELMKFALDRFFLHWTKPSIQYPTSYTQFRDISYPRPANVWYSDRLSLCNRTRCSRIFTYLAQTARLCIDDILGAVISADDVATMRALVELGYNYACKQMPDELFSDEMYEVSRICNDRAHPCYGKRCYSRDHIVIGWHGNARYFRSRLQDLHMTQWRHSMIADQSGTYHHLCEQRKDRDRAMLRECIVRATDISHFARYVIADGSTDIMELIFETVGREPFIRMRDVYPDVNIRSMRFLLPRMIERRDFDGADAHVVAREIAFILDSSMDFRDWWSASDLRPLITMSPLVHRKVREMFVYGWHVNNIPPPLQYTEEQSEMCYDLGLCSRQSWCAIQ